MIPDEWFYKNLNCGSYYKTYLEKKKFDDKIKKDVDEAAEIFKEKLESRFYKSRKEEYRILNESKEDENEVLRDKINNAASDFGLLEYIKNL